MTVRPKWPGVWIIDVKVRTTRGQTVRKRRTYRGSKRGAERVELELRHALELGLYDDGEPCPTLSGFAGQYLAHCERTNKPATVDRKRREVAHLVRILGSVRLDEVTPRHGQRVAARLGLGPGTTRNVLATLRHVLGVARDWGHIDAVPKIERVRYEQAEVDYLDDDDVEQLLGLELAPHWRLAVVLGLDTGARIGELLGLKWCDVLGDALTIERQLCKVSGELITTKGGRPRQIPLTTRARAALDEARSSRVVGLRLVPFSHSAAMHAMIAVRPRLGRFVGWHTLRHTYATRLVRAGVHLRVVQQLMGHSTITVTERYAHLAPGLTRAAVDLLEDKEGRARGAGPRRGRAK